MIWGVATLVFFLLRAVPGDPIAAMLADVDPSAAEALRAKLGLDQPVYVQYGIWMGNLLRGDLGNSIYGNNQPVSQILREALPRTLSLTAIALVIALTLSLTCGHHLCSAQGHLGRLYGDVRRISGSEYAGFLARHTADHRLRGQAELAAGNRL